MKFKGDESWLAFNVLVKIEKEVRYYVTRSSDRMGWGIDLSTLLGALIAGIIGIIAGILTALFNSRYEDLTLRRREHFQAHRKNLDLIKRETSSILGEIFPPWKSGFDGTGTPWLGKHNSLDKQTLEEIKNNEIRRVSDFRFSEFAVIYQARQDLTAALRQDSADSNLIWDLANHFPDLSAKINQYEELIRKDGAKLLYDFYYLSDGIYEELDKRGYTGTAAGSYPAYLKDELPVLTIARVVFNKSLDISKEYWRGANRIYTGYAGGRYQAYLDELETVSNEFHSTDVAKEIRQLMIDIEQKEREINKEIEQTMLITKLPNKCFYLM